MNLQKPKIIPFSRSFLIQSLAGSTHFLNAVQQIVDEILPESLWLNMKSNSDLETTLDHLVAMLPLFKCSDLDESSKSLSVSYLCPAEYTRLARRCVADVLSKWLIPGKQMDLTGGIGLTFRFANGSFRDFFAAQEIVSIRHREEALAIRKNLPDLIAALKQKLSRELFSQSENTVHPLFMPRNEEETIRNLIVLATEIKYIRDLPQASIHYEKQTDADLTFTVIIARLLKGIAEPLRKLLEKSRLKVDIDNIRIMGYLKQKYAKEAAVLRVTVDKRSFFRPDYSVDLLRARQKVVSGLKECLGEFRDFNGGMILKQDEALGQLRQELGKMPQERELLLEHYFYSLKPAIMQTVHDPSILKRHFELLSSILESGLKRQPYQVVGESLGKFFLCFIAAASPTFKEGVLNAIAPLEISSRDLSTSFLEIGSATAMGFILRMESPKIAQQFQAAVVEAFQEWSRRLYCPIIDGP